MHYDATYMSFISRFCFDLFLCSNVRENGG